MTFPRFLRSLYDEWLKVYRFHGGWRTELRCLLGAWNARRGKVSTIPALGQVDVVTFSVIPKMSALWAYFSLDVARRIPMRIFISDSSGSLPRFLAARPGLQILPIFNYAHGSKLDILVNSVCSAPFVIISDDDIFWIGHTAIEWALAQFANNPKLAVVSLLPKDYTPDLLKEKVQQPMGSLFIIRREIWLRESLSFEVDNTPLKLGMGIYDTGEKAQTQLLEAGYEIIYLPPELRKDFVPLKGISVWILKAQKNNGDLREHLRSNVGLQEKVFQMIVSARHLSSLFSKISPETSDTALTAPVFLSQIETLCRNLLLAEQVQTIETEVEQKMSRLAAVLDSK